MRLTLVSGLLLCVIAAVASAQSPEEEIAHLKAFLKLSDAAVELAAVPTLPSRDPVKVFIATGLDVGARQNFLKWADEWNRRDSKKHGRIELVQDVAGADVVLARVVSRENATSATDTTVSAGVVPTSQGLKLAPYARQYSYTSVPVVAYVLAQPSPGRLHIVWRYTGTTTIEETNDSGKQLWDDFKTLMKKKGRLAR